jgi:rare lipoprotein A
MIGLIAALTCGISTYYGVGDGFHGQTTANGERFDAYRWTAAHPYLPMGTRIRVTNQDNGKQVIVRVNDRGPYSHADLDLSYAAFAHISSVKKGNAVVCCCFPLLSLLRKHIAHFDMKLHVELKLPQNFLKILVL